MSWLGVLLFKVVLGWVCTGLKWVCCDLVRSVLVYSGYVVLLCLGRVCTDLKWVGRVSIV